MELYNGDCLEIMKNIPDNSINLVLIDPPYNIGKDKKWDKWKTVEDYIEFMGEVFLEIQRILKGNGSFYFFHNDFMQIVELQNFINKNTDFVFKQFLVWNKRFEGARMKGYLDGHCMVEGLRNYKKMAEYCLFYTFQDDERDQNDEFKKTREYFKDEKKKNNLTYKDINRALGTASNGGGMASHYFGNKQWSLPTEEMYERLQANFEGAFLRPYEELKEEYENAKYVFNTRRYAFNNHKVNHSVMNYDIAKKQGHITPKPTDLLEYLILTSSNEGDVVLDCFMGSGSTGVACANTNRHFIGIEKEEEYFEIAKKRIKESQEAKSWMK